jgi:hypothetical protein
MEGGGMSDYRWTLKDLHTSEQALERHRAQIASGERKRGLIRLEPGCERACPTCDLRCALLVGCVRTTRDGLIAQGDDPDVGNLLVHDGIAYDLMVGRA